MNKRTLINLGLVIVIIVLFVLSTSLNQKPAVETQPVSNISPATISQITVSRPDKPDLEFIKKNNVWFMQSPLQIRVNHARINAMLKLLNSESHGQFGVREVNLASLELEQPTVVLKMDEHEFQFGTTDAIDQRRYVLFNNTVYMVNDFLYAQLITSPGFFADTRLIPEEKKITAITFPENKFELVDNEWRMRDLMDIKPEQMQRLAYSWEHAVAISVSYYQQPQQDFPIIITTADGQTLRFNIVTTEPHLVLGRKDLGVQYHMGSDEAQKLLLQEKPVSEASPG